MRIGVDLVHPALLRYGVRIIAPPSVSATVPHPLTDSAERAEAPRLAITGRSSKIALCCHMRHHHIRRCFGPGADEPRGICPDRARSPAELGDARAISRRARLVPWPKPTPAVCGGLREPELL